MLILSLLHTAECLSVPKVWQRYLRMLVQQYNSQPCHFVTPTNVLGSCSAMEIFYPLLPLLPEVILWEPASQYPCIFPSGIACPFSECNEVLNMHHWNVGQNECSQPRLVHSASKPILLVSGVYRCKNGHQILSHDPRLLQLFSSPHTFPFILTHKSAFVSELVRLSVSMIRHGMHFQQIETMIREQRAESLNHLQTLSNSNCDLDIDGLCVSVTELCKYLETLYMTVPSRHIITEFFLSDFFSKEQYYKNEILSTYCESALSIDHTFKVAAHVGYYRSDGQWVSQYDSLFIVLNEIGEVVSWMFTKSTAFDEVRPLLKDISRRMMIYSGGVKHLYIDNCCMWSDCLKSVFGTNVCIHLDLFHAVQRITRTLSKRHTNYYPCISELKLVFREIGDIGLERKLSTPSPQILTDNIDKFASKWSTVTDSEIDTPIIKEKTRKEIQNLKVHIQKGCLSDIPQGMGTNKNEALHRRINPYFSTSRMGVRTAYALLMVLFVAHNSSVRKLKNNGKTCANTIKNPLSMVYHDHSYAKPLKEHLGLIPKDNADARNDIWQNRDLSDYNSSWEMIDNTNFDANDQDAELISMDEARHILLHSLHLVQLTGVLQNLITVPTFPYHLTPFMSATPSLFTSSVDSGSYEAHEARLQHTIDNLDGIRVPVEGDGNCCFSAVAIAIKELQESSSDTSVKEHLATLPIDITADLQGLAYQLRLIAVSEWLEHKDYYQSFLTSERVETSAIMFLQQGHFHGELGNTMVLSLANALKLTVIIISSIPNQPIIRIDPRDVAIAVPLFLSFCQYGAGHYDAVIMKSIKVNETTMCRCGNNDKNSNKHRCTSVIVQSQKYSSRCPCFRTSKACGKKCKCKGCRNPYGMHKDTKKVLKRKRHGRSRFKVYVKSDREFLSSRQEILRKGKFSQLEYFVFSEILKRMDKKKVSAAGPTANEILTVLTKVHDCASVLNVSLPINIFTLEDIQHLKESHDKSRKSFQVLYCKK